MPVFSDLRTTKRKARNRQRYIYGYTTEATAANHLEGSGVMETGDVNTDLTVSEIDFDGSPKTTSSASYTGAPLLTNLSLNGAMGSTLNFDFSVLIEVLEDFDNGTPTTTIIEPADMATYETDYGTTRYYCQGDNEPVEFNWNVSLSYTNSGCIYEDVSKTAKVRIDSLNATITQYFEDAFPTGDNTYIDATDSGATVTVDYCTNSLFLPPEVGVGTGGDDSNPLLGLWDFDVSEKGTEYTPDNATGRKFITLNCDGIPEYPGDWLDFPVIGDGLA